MWFLIVVSLLANLGLFLWVTKTRFDMWTAFTNLHERMENIADEMENSHKNVTKLLKMANEESE